MEIQTPCPSACGAANSLAGYWHFDEGQGNTVRDQIGANGHPTMQQHVGGLDAIAPGRNIAPV
jgi:hypothetical protein